MSIFSRDFELMVIFRAADHIWDAALGKDRKEDDFQRHITSTQNFDNWKMGKPIKSSTADRIFDKTIALIQGKRDQASEAREEIIAGIEAFRAGFKTGEEDFNVRAAARTLGMAIDDAYIAIDKEEASIAPLFPALLYRANETSQKKACISAFNNLRGAYQVFIRRVDQQGGLIYMQGALRVRYIFETSHWWGVRCKLNIPVIDPRKQIREYKNLPAHYQYRGWMNASELDHVAFLMEFSPDANVGDGRGDYFHIMTSWKTKAADGTIELRGRYMTMSQDTPRAPVSDELIMRRVTRDDDNAIISCMRDIKVLKTQEEIGFAKALIEGAGIGKT